MAFYFYFHIHKNHNIPTPLEEVSCALNWNKNQHMNCIQGGKINIGDCAANVTDVSLKVVQNLDTVNPREM